MSILGFLLFLIVAAVCAWIAEAVFPGRVPGGFLASAIVGVIGAWIGTSLFGHIGPDLAGVPILSAIIGAGILVMALALLSNVFVRNRI
jgi:uncharacterized membrane protein YeaQ/YmgE (transglycosylase-associated protein family)